MQVRDRDGRQEDPDGQTALAPDRVVMLGPTVHLGPKANSLVLRVTRVVSRHVRNVIEHRLAGRAQPGQRVVVDAAQGSRLMSSGTFRMAVLTAQSWLRAMCQTRKPIGLTP